MTADVKRTQSSAETLGSARKAHDYVGEIKGELTKIDWTSPEELKTYTKIVVLATFFMGMGTYLVDLTIQGMLNLLSSFVHLIAG